MLLPIKEPPCIQETEYGEALCAFSVNYGTI